MHKAHLTKKWDTLNTLPPGQSKQGEAWGVILECRTEYF